MVVPPVSIITKKRRITIFKGPGENEENSILTGDGVRSFPLFLVTV